MLHSIKKAVLSTREAMMLLLRFGIAGFYSTTNFDIRSQGYKPVQSLENAKDSITSLQVTDKLIVSASVDGNIRTYDVRNGLLTTDCVGRKSKK